MQIECRISSLLEYYAEMQLWFCKVKQKDDTKQIIVYYFSVLMDYFSLLQNNHLISLDSMFQPYALTSQNKEKMMLLFSYTLYTLLYIYKFR